MILSSTQQNQVISLLIDKIPGLEAIYLFGSGVTQDHYTDASDVDLAFKANQPVDQLLLWELKNELANLVHREVDLVDLTAADTVLRMQVVGTGQRMYASDFAKSEAWDSLVYSMYLKLNDDRREILDEIAKSGKIYG